MLRAYEITRNKKNYTYHEFWSEYGVSKSIANMYKDFDSVGDIIKYVDMKNKGMVGEDKIQYAFDNRDLEKLLKEESDWKLVFGFDNKGKKELIFRGVYKGDAKSGEDYLNIGKYKSYVEGMKNLADVVIQLEKDKNYRGVRDIDGIIEQIYIDLGVNDIDFTKIKKLREIDEKKVKEMDLVFKGTTVEFWEKIRNGKDVINYNELGPIKVKIGGKDVKGFKTHFCLRTPITPVDYIGFRYRKNNVENIYVFKQNFKEKDINEFMRQYEKYVRGKEKVLRKQVNKDLSR